MPGPGMPPQQMQQQQPPQSQQHQRTENAQHIMNQVAHELTQQPPLGGWKDDVPIKVRAMNVYQM